MMLPALTNILYPTQQARDLRVVALRAQIIALQAAERSGITRASYDGKSVDYRDLNELRQALAGAQAELLQLMGIQYRRPSAGFAVFRRGNG